MTININEIEYIPPTLKDRLPEVVETTATEYTAMVDTLRVLVREVREDEGWAIGTIFVDRYNNQSRIPCQGIRHTPN